MNLLKYLFSFNLIITQYLLCEDQFLTEKPEVEKIYMDNRQQRSSSISAAKANKNKPDPLLVLVRNWFLRLKNVKISSSTVPDPLYHDPVCDSDYRLRIKLCRKISDISYFAKDLKMVFGGPMIFKASFECVKKYVLIQNTDVIYQQNMYYCPMYSTDGPQFYDNFFISQSYAKDNAGVFVYVQANIRIPDDSNVIMELFVPDIVIQNNEIVDNNNNNNN